LKLTDFTVLLPDLNASCPKLLPQYGNVFIHDASNPNKGPAASDLVFTPCLSNWRLGAWGDLLYVYAKDEDCDAEMEDSFALYISIVATDILKRDAGIAETARPVNSPMCNLSR
jgi:hypothetical protein